MNLVFLIIWCYWNDPLKYYCRFLCTEQENGGKVKIVADGNKDCGRWKITGVLSRIDN